MDRHHQVFIGLRCSSRPRVDDVESSRCYTWTVSDLFECFPRPIARVFELDTFCKDTDGLLILRIARIYERSTGRDEIRLLLLKRLVAVMKDVGTVIDHMAPTISSGSHAEIIFFPIPPREAFLIKATYSIQRSSPDIHTETVSRGDARVVPRRMSTKCHRIVFFRGTFWQVVLVPPLWSRKGTSCRTWASPSRYDCQRRAHNAFPQANAG